MRTLESPGPGQRIAITRPYAVIAVLLAATGTAEVVAHAAGTASLPWLLLVIGCMTLPIAVVRSQPLIVPLLALGVFALEEWLDGWLSEAITPFLALMVVMFAGMAYGSQRAARIVAAASYAVVLGSVVLFEEGGADADSLVYAALVVTAALTAGRVVAGRGMRIDQLEDERVRVAREQHERVVAAAAEERMRIARELHDVVTHRVSAMVLQAAAERRARSRADQSTSSDETVEAALASIEQLGRDALAELRQLLGALHRDGSEGSRLPQPSVEDVPQLVEEAERASLPTSYDVAGDPREVSRGVALSIYRIVQEALSNAMRHAAGGTASVRVRYGADDVGVVVTSRGGHPARDASGSGTGIAGMRERVEFFGGTFAADTDDDGAFVVHATFPSAPAQVPAGRPT